MERRSVTVLDAPVISLDESELAGDALIKFYQALGWNGQDIVDPSKVRTTKAVFDRLYDLMREKCPDGVTVGMAMVNKGPGVDEHIAPGKVHLLADWVIPSMEGE